MPVSFLGGRKGMERSSFKLSSAIAFLCFGLSLLELLKTNTYNMIFFKKSLKLKEGKRAYLLACCSVRQSDLDLKMNKNHILYIFKP